MRTAFPILALFLVASLFLAPAEASEPNPPAPEAPAPPQRAWIGVWLADAVDGGVRVVALVPGGPGEEAGLVGGDVILSARGVEIPGQQALERLLLESNPGDSLALQVIRGGTTLEKSIRLRAREADAGSWSIAPRFTAVRPERPLRSAARREIESVLQVRRTGLRVAEVTPMLRAHYGAPEEAGLLVIGVESGALADQAGILVGDILVRIGDQPLVGRREFERALREWSGAESATAQLIRGGESRLLVIPAVARSEKAAVDTGRALDTARRFEQQAREQMIRIEIERLERRLDELRLEAEGLRREEPSP